MLETLGPDREGVCRSEDHVNRQEVIGSFGPAILLESRSSVGLRTSDQVTPLQDPPPQHCNSDDQASNTWIFGEQTLALPSQTTPLQSYPSFLGTAVHS